MSLKKGAAAPAVTLSLVLSVLAFAPLPPAPSNHLPDNPLDGRTLFQEKLCIKCHWIAGEGPSIGPRLGDARFQGTFLELGADLWNHAPAMSTSFETTGYTWPQLTGDEAAELVAFLYFINYLGRPGVAADGRDVFRERGCFTCHVIGGGPRKVGPDLAELRAFASPLNVAQQIWNHGPSMFASMRAAGIRPPSFEPGDLADLSAFIRQQAGPDPRPPALPAAGNPNEGRRLFSKKGCAACHGPGARGGGGGPDLSVFDLHQPAEAIAGLMWNHALVMSDAMRERGIGWPRFQGSELADLVAFLYFLRYQDPPGDARRGARIFAERSCADCHSGKSAEGRPTGPNLLQREPVPSAAELVAAMWNHAPIMKKAILGEGLPWPELQGNDLRDLYAYLVARASRGAESVAQHGRRGGSE